MKDEEKKEDEVKEEAVEESTEEVKEDAPVEAEAEEVAADEAEDAKDDEQIDKIISRITHKITDELKANRKASETSVAKKKALTREPVRHASQKVKAYMFKSGKRAGEHYEFDSKDAELCANWYKAFIDGDKKLAREITTKLEPLNEGVNADGGFIVPVVLANFLTEVKEDVSVIRPRSRVIDMSGMKTNQLDISGIATKPRVGWTEELAAKSTSSMTFRQISLTPYKMTAIITLSTELRDDSPFNVLSIVGEKLGEAVAREEDRVFINGTGAGQPTGIDSYGLAAINAGGALTYDHILNAYYLMPQAYRANGYWIMNSRTIAAVRRLKDTTNNYILQNFGFITDPNIPAILGRPVLENNNATSARIFFVDLSNYYIADKGGFKLDTSTEAVVADTSLWETNLVGVKVEERVDAELEPVQSGVEIQNTGIA